MPQITLPDMKMPDMKMPDVKMPDVNLPDVKMPDGLRDLEMPKFDLSKVELPKQLTDLMPKRNRRSPILPIAGFLAIGAAIAAAWWLITSPLTGPRIRATVKNLRSRMTDESTDLLESDKDADLGRLLSDAPEAARSSIAADPYAASNGMDDLETVVAVGPGEVRDTVRAN